MIPYYTRFFLLAFLIILLQVLLFDHINLFGFSNPAVYVLLFIIYRIDLDQFNFIIVSFFLGLTLDVLTHTAGAHSFASVSIAFIRPLVSRFSLGANHDQPNAVFSNTLLSNRLLFIFLMTLIHQLLFTAMAYFAFAHLWLIIKHSIVNSIFSFILITSIMSLLKPKK